MKDYRLSKTNIYKYLKLTEASTKKEF